MLRYLDQKLGGALKMTRTWSSIAGLALLLALLHTPLLNAQG